jgi:hypothetical protein
VSAGHGDPGGYTIGRINGRIDIDTGQAEANIRALSNALRELDAVRYRPASSNTFLYLWLMFILGCALGAVIAATTRG